MRLLLNKTLDEREYDVRTFQKNSLTRKISDQENQKLETKMHKKKIS